MIKLFYLYRFKMCDAPIFLKFTKNFCFKLLICSCTVLVLLIFTSFTLYFSLSLISNFRKKTLRLANTYSVTPKTLYVCSLLENSYSFGKVSDMVTPYQPILSYAAFPYHLVREIWSFWRVSLSYRSASSFPSLNEGSAWLSTDFTHFHAVRGGTEKTCSQRVWSIYS